MYSEYVFIKILRSSFLLEEGPSKLSMAAFKEILTLETFLSLSYYVKVL